MKVLDKLNEWAIESEDVHFSFDVDPFKIQNEGHITFKYYCYGKQDVKKSLREDRIETDKYLLEYISPILLKHNIYRFNTVDTPNIDARTQVWKYDSNNKWSTTIGQLKFYF